MKNALATVEINTGLLTRNQNSKHTDMSLSAPPPHSQSKSQQFYTKFDHTFYRPSYASTVLAASVCLSVCPSQVAVVQRWLNLWSHKQRHTIVFS